MSPTVHLTEGTIRSAASRESFERGRQYYEEGAISGATISGNSLVTLSARCAGTSAPYYWVRAVLDAAGVQSATCTCPYEFGGYCKHIVALLETYIHEPESFEPRPSPDELLKALERADLEALLTQLMQADEAVQRQVERWVTTKEATKAPDQAGKADTKTKPKSLKVDPYRGRLQSAIERAHGRYEYEYEYDDGGDDEELSSELESIRKSIGEFLEAGQPENTMALVLAMVEEVKDSQNSSEFEIPELEDFLSSLDLPLAEAVLSQTLDAGTRRTMQETLKADTWTFAASLAALKDGWKAKLEPPAAASQAATQDEEQDADRDGGDDDDDDGEDDEDASDIEGVDATAINSVTVFGHRLAEHDVSDAKLNVLNRRGDVDGFLKVALEDSKHARYIQKLIELDRASEATRHAERHLTQAPDALLIAQQLRERGNVTEAIVVARHGLTLKLPRAALGRWLGPMAESQGDAALAAAAWTAVFHETPSLQLYQHIEELAGKRWKAIKPDLIKRARETIYADAVAEILLYEREWDEAIALAKSRGVDNRTAQIVADGVVNHRPEWVIDYGRKAADRQIATVSSSHYPAAVDWLMRVKKAYVASGQGEVWNKYFATLRETFKRRPSLQKQFERLKS